MAKAMGNDWGFAEITAKFERAAKFEREPERQRQSQRHARPSLKVRPPASIRSSGMMHVGLWLSAVAILLIGLVSLHVLILQKNIEYNSLIEEKNNLSAGNAHLASQVSALSSPERIESLAVGPLGMVAPKTVQYVYIGPSSARQNYADLGPDNGPGGRGMAVP